MGNFAGHIDEGVVFMTLALWWLYNMAKSYFQCLEEGRPYRSHLSYPSMIRGRQVPLEIGLKILFPVCGFLAELFIGKKLHFVDDDGNFIHPNGMQHMTIYFMFTVHGITDLIDYLHLTAMKDMKYITGALSFLVIVMGCIISAFKYRIDCIDYIRKRYGIGFYYHSDPSTNKPPLELIVHRLPVYTMFITTLVALIENFKRDSVVIQIIRCHVVLTFGTWFTYVAFILYNISEPLSKHHNKAWDQYNKANVHFMVTAFVCHLIGNSLIIMTSFYFAESYRKCRGFIARQRGRVDVKYEKSPLIDVDDSEFDENVI